MSLPKSTTEQAHLAKYQLVEVDSSVRPARVTVLSCHESKKKRLRHGKRQPSQIDFYDISHSVVEL